MKNKKIKRAAGKTTALRKHGKHKKGLRNEKPKAPATTAQASEPNGLSEDEQETFTRCEAAIEKGMASTVEVANAFHIIQDNKLYRANYGSFQAYCKARWKLSRQQGYRLAEMGALNEQLAATGNVITRENQARLLKKVPKEKLARVMARAKDFADGGKIERKHSVEAIEELCSEPASNKKGEASGDVVKLPTLQQDAISVVQIRHWAEQALENLKNNADKDGTIELMTQIVSALFIIDTNKNAQHAA